MRNVYFDEAANSMRCRACDVEIQFSADSGNTIKQLEAGIAFGEAHADCKLKSKKGQARMSETTT